MFDSSFFFHLFPIMFRYIDVTLGISLAALLLGVLVGSLFSELAAIVAGLCCCAAAYLLLRVLDRRFARMQALQPRMISITTNEEDEEHGQGTDGGEF